MTAKEIDFLSSREMLGFTLPVMHTKGSNWYVDFYAHDPVSGRMKRKKYMLNKFKTDQKKRMMGSLLIYNITAKLTAGWNPWVNVDKSRQFTEIPIIIGRYRDYVKAMTDKKSMKEKTSIDYLSRVKMLETFIEECKGIKYAYQLDRSFVIDFLDHLMYDRDVSATTRNNYRSWFVSFGTWLMDRKYITENPAIDIRNIAQTEKFRDPLSDGALRRLKEYLYDHNKHFLLACLFEYFTFIRPNELTQIKIGDVSIKDQTVFISSSISKNRKDGLVALNDEILKLMIELKIFEHPSQNYIFGKSLKPGDTRAAYNQLRVEWGKMRTALGFPKEYQFYSLKDTGIRDLANAQGIVVAKEQARHSDISVTNRYIKNQMKVNEETKHFKGSL